MFPSCPTLTVTLESSFLVSSTSYHAYLTKIQEGFRLIPKHSDSSNGKERSLFFSKKKLTSISAYLQERAMLVFSEQEYMTLSYLQLG